MDYFFIIINDSFGTYVECSCEEIAIETAKDLFRIIDDSEEITKIQVKKL